MQTLSENHQWLSTNVIAAFFCHCLLRQVPVVPAAAPGRGLGSAALLVRHSRTAGLVHAAGKEPSAFVWATVTVTPPVSILSISVLGAYQAEFGDYEPEQPRPVDYVTQWTFAPNQNKEMEEKILELHKSHRSVWAPLSHNVNLFFFCLFCKNNALTRTQSPRVMSQRAPF